MSKKPNPEKALKHAAKGDSHFQKGRYDRALKEYRRAEEIDPSLPGIYDKLNQAHDRQGSEWKMDDFARSVSWTMEGQAQRSPPIRQVHAMLTPEWREASEIAYRILAARGQEDVSADVERLVGMGEVATRALIGVLLEIRQKFEAPAEPGRGEEEGE
ncbi:MAG: tetratricopeptide repeat protein [Proteobacteria bacterium]|nr:tetratricopeptide repeat protein [Pseudomonadota bacterium]